VRLNILSSTNGAAIREFELFNVPAIPAQP
jgi:hypothetical protein